MTSSEDTFSGAIAVLEAVSTAQTRGREAVKALGFRLAVESGAESIERRVASSDPPAVLLVGLPEASALVDRLQRLPRPPVIVASLAGPPASARQRFHEGIADLYAVRPHSVESLGPVLQAASLLAEHRQEIRSLKSTEARLKRRLEESGQSGSLAGFQHLDFFKKFLQFEMKRAKRFDYPIAVCVVAHDEPSSAVKAHVREALVRRVSAAIVANIRDIDLPVEYSEQHMLLFLPYTDAEGAKEVADRVLLEVRKSGQLREEGTRVRMTVSIGVAATQKGGEIRFSKLIRDAMTALKAAQCKGGNRAVLR